MEQSDSAKAVTASAVPPRRKLSNYPEPFASRLAGRAKRPLGDLFGLSNFGVNLTTLAPGARSALQHQHSKQDEFVYVIEGELWLISGTQELLLTAGMCSGFKAGGLSHHLVNRSAAPVSYLEIGDRTQGDSASYPEDDLQAVLGPAGWLFAHKDGTPY
ncbi:MAG TPA: cupin domain-containing protein [Devosia sp.]|nr:cupin domain-containing protein [Devosia sp.]